MESRIFVFLFLLCAAAAFPQGSQSAGQFQDYVFTLRPASVALTVDETVGPLTNTSAFDVAKITLDLQTLTLADADDKVCFYFQTTYGGGFWVDTETVCFTDADDGTTPRKLIIIDGAVDGPGTISGTLVGTDPATDAEISETVPANTIWRLRALEFKLITDASGTPVPEIWFTDGTTEYLACQTAVAQTVSTTVQYHAAANERGTYPSGNVHMNCPAGFASIFLTAGHTWQTNTSALAGDDYGEIRYSVEAWHDPASPTDAAMGDNLKSYGRPVGSQIRVRTKVTGATAPTYAYSVHVLLKASQ